MACGGVNFNLLGFVSIFRLLILGAIIFFTMGIAWFAANQDAKTRLLIALAVCIFYGLSDMILNWILGLACQCRAHSGNGNGNKANNKNKNKCEEKCED